MTQHTRPSTARTLAAATTALSLLLAACASASAQAPAQGPAQAAERQAAERQTAEKQAAREQAEAAASQAYARAAEKQAAREQADAAVSQAHAQAAEAAMAAEQARQNIEQRTSVVLPAAGNAVQASQALKSALEGTVQATALGGSIVVSGTPENLKRAQELLAQMNAFAQSEDDRSRRESMLQQERLEEVRQRDARADQRIIDVTLGPTLGDTLKALSTSVGGGNGEGLNVVYAANSDVAKLPVRNVQLQRVSLQSALSTLQTTLVGPDGRPNVMLEMRNTNIPGERPVVTVTPPRASRSSEEATTYQLAVFRLRAVEPGLDPASASEIQHEHANLLEAIDVGLEIVGRSPEFKIKLHPATGMMFVHGLRPEIRVVAEVLGENDPTTTPAPPTPAAAANAPAASGDSGPATAPTAAAPNSKPRPPAAGR